MGDLLQELSSDEIDKLFPNKKKRKFVGDWIEHGRQQEQRVPSYFKDARDADPADLSEVNFPTVYDSEKGRWSFPLRAKRIDSPTEIYKLPLEPGKKLWIKVKDPKITDLDRADAAKLPLLMKDGKIEIVLQKIDEMMKVSPDQLENHMQRMNKQLAPKK